MHVCSVRLYGSVTEREKADVTLLGMFAGPWVCRTLQVTVTGAAVVAAAAVLANTAESYLGAVAQGKVEWLTNDAVNMLQIMLAAAVAVALQEGLQLQ